MTADAKQGPLSVQELLGLWQNAVDRSYQEPLQAAGEGGGFEAYTQMFAQLARLSLAIDTTTQALYVRPWSGQTNLPAAGAQLATVQLSFTRTGMLNTPLRIAANTLYVGELVNDHSERGSAPVATGRRYLVTQEVVFLPGESGPVLASASAELPGYGYNNPRPATIRLPSQNGSGYYHDRGTVTVSTAPLASPQPQPPPNTIATLTAVNEPEMFVSDHVGQQLVFTAGANQGVVARISSVLPPSGAAGTSAVLEGVVAFETASITGAFGVGNLVQVTNTMGSVLAWGQLVAVNPRPGGGFRLGYVFLSGTLATGVTLRDFLTGATCPIGLYTSLPAISPEAPPVPATLGSGASWRVLDWGVDWGLGISNAAQPTGGVAAMLDAIGEERNIPRAAGEADASYRERVANVPDTTTPNAEKRAIARVLGPAVPYCFREIGTSAMLGVFYDRTNDPAGDYYDVDCVQFVNGTGSTVTPFQNEAVEWRDGSGNVLMRGWMGNVPAGGILSLATFSIIRKSGLGSLSNPIPSGLIYLGQLYCLSSGVVINPAVNTVVNLGMLKRSAYYFDYTQFRAFFKVGLPNLGYGEFGFAHGTLPAGFPNGRYHFYDAAPFGSAYDGYPYQAAAIYRQVYAAILKAKPAGATFEIYREDGVCPT